MTREITLSNGMVSLVDDEDYAFVSAHKWYSNGRAPHRYARTQIDGVQVALHRALMNAPEDMQVDHINRNTLDNRRANLRLCTARQNLLNRGYTKTAKGASQYKGVNLSDGRFRAYIVVHGKWITLGGFSDEIKAAVAYDNAAREHFGEFAKLNFSPDRDWILPAPEPTNRTKAMKRAA